MAMTTIRLELHLSDENLEAVKRISREEAEQHSELKFDPNDWRGFLASVAMHAIYKRIDESRAK